MTKYQFAVTIGATAVQLSAAAATAGAPHAFPAGASGLYGAGYLPCTKLIVEMQGGSTGVGYLGDSTVTSSGGGGADQVPPGSGSNPGVPFILEAKTNDHNSIDLSQFYLHGSNAGDKASVIYFQA
jgi:hypothetical protein